MFIKYYTARYKSLINSKIIIRFGNEKRLSGRVPYLVSTKLKYNTTYNKLKEQTITFEVFLKTLYTKNISIFENVDG